jgi:phage terminase small subunit
LAKRTKTASVATTAPAHLTAEAAAWFGRLASEYGIEDEAGLLMLRAAMESFDRADQARALIAKQGMTSMDKYGQRRPHPAIAIERDSRKNLLAFLKALNLDLEPLRDGPGRPPGR